jgi:pimeloyl-ACP methyl ester carboxylesterase
MTSAIQSSSRHVRLTRLAQSVLAGLLAVSLITPATAQAQPALPCVTGVLPGGALSLICVPPGGWNGDLVVYAHGYVAANQPLGFYNLDLPDGTSLPEIVLGLGYAFATTSYRQNGLTVLEGVEDIKQLVQAFPTVAGQTPNRTYLAGVSEGGLIATLLAERAPELFTGVLATCGPIGSFRSQINYFGDFRVLFDYFFPGAIPGSPIHIPDEVINNWEAVYAPAVAAQLAANPAATAQLRRTSKATLDPADPVPGALQVLWYNVFATNDARDKLGGNPFDNRTRWYFGSSNDLRLNRRVQRFAADPAALAALQSYETSGALTVPLVTLHTTGDETIPFWHELLYLGKVRPSGNGSFLPIPIFRYGHCNFTADEVLAAFGLLVLQTTGQEVAGLEQRFTVAQARSDFATAQRQFLTQPENRQLLEMVGGSER